VVIGEVVILFVRAEYYMLALNLTAFEINNYLKSPSGYFCQVPILAKENERKKKRELKGAANRSPQYFYTFKFVFLWVAIAMDQ
jgi:hypothetical protein